jgi:hypothetical protein
MLRTNPATSRRAANHGRQEGGPGQNDMDQNMNPNTTLTSTLCTFFSQTPYHSWAFVFFFPEPLFVINALKSVHPCTLEGSFSSTILSVHAYTFLPAVPPSSILLLFHWSASDERLC